MDLTRLILDIRKNPSVGIAVAIVLTSTAVVLRMAMSVTLIYVTFYPAIIIATIAAGWKAGAGVVLVATLCAAYFFVSPAGSMTLQGSDIWNIGAFWLVCAAIIAITNLLVDMLLASSREADNLAELNEELAEAEEQKGILMHELAHRMKNQYAVILAMVRAMNGNMLSVAEFKENFSERLQGMSKTHDLLTKEGWEAVSLLNLVHSELEPLAEPGRLDVNGEEVRLKEQAAVNIGMAIHELATNAAKHGAWSESAGKVIISWSLTQEDLIFRWVELDGPEVSEALRRGFGRTMLEMIVPSSLHGNASLDYAKTGLRWTLRVPNTWVEQNYTQDKITHRGVRGWSSGKYLSNDRSRRV